MEDRAAFVSEFKTVARRKGTSPEDLFADYDRDESGIIRFDFFRRILSSINFWVDEKRLEAITSEFIDGRNFHYADFMNTSGTQLTKRDGVTDADIAEFGRQLQARRIYLIDTLEAYDVHHFGHVSSMNFLRSFGNTPLNNKICNHFKGSTDEVDYLLLNKEIKRVLSSYGDKQTVPEPKLDSIPPYFSTIAQDIQAQGIELYPIFLGLDRFKRGTIPKLAFQKTLNGYKFHVNANQLSQVIDLFTDDQGTVPYKAFCEEIDKAIRQLPKTTKSTFAVKGDINTTLNYLRDVVKNRHCQIEDQLKACDRRNTGLIPSQRFFKALATEQYKITNQDMDVLEQEFTDGRGNIEYTRFLEAILPSTRQTTDSADKTLMRLKNFLDERKIQIRPRLQRYESDGSVSSAELLQVLRALSFDMTQRESQTLIALLAPRVNSRINLDDLCNQIDPILPVRKSAIQIEEEAAAASKTYAKPESREEPPENIEDILVGVLKFAERNGIDFQTEFRQRDSHRNGTVPRS
ncbi:hypothetical protein TRFO_40384 [Tritrichomonas foetus]|uniref:EF-hand domain-containing protein n=1 Tax=Tritrichomonas foetus TaxID=1144522 RepID=A0A1J4J1T0_9EUKA|nr:hypothetical protein TRFO_40384 [Tritrichomonas foetus]|eukprot:OHS93346.1 hypothetical protein TRFO_40384 [Tritrichomonas foetus]